MSEPGLKLRALTPDDLDQALKIEQQSSPAPWTHQDFVAELQAETARCTGAFDGQGRLLGFLCARQVLDEAEISNLACSPERRRQGLASNLLQAFLSLATATGVRRVFLEVRQSNGGAQALYRAHGFVETGRRPGYYRPGGEDAVLMSLALEATQG